MSAPSFLVSLLYGLGLVLVFIAERLVATGTGRTVLDLAGIACVGVSLGWRLVRAGKSTAKSASSERLFLSLYLLGALALVIYFGQSDVARSLWGKPFDQRFPKWSGVLAVAWPVLIAASLLPIVFGELSYRSMARAPVVEFGRVTGAVLSGVGLLGALVFAFAIYYVASERDLKVDLSYMRTAKPGASTRKVVRGLEEPVQVSLFFPPANEVREAVLEYFQSLAKESPKLQVRTYDKDVDVAKARELGVTGNGAVVFSRGARKEQLILGQRIESARSQLANLDREAQKRLLQVARAKRTLYFTTGHGERSETSPMVVNQRSTISTLKDLLRSQNYEVKTLSAVEGLGSEIPSDAAAVLVVGPTQNFLPEERTALSRYIDGGGRVLLALDPETPVDFSSVLRPLGVSLSTVLLANDRAFWARTHQLSDRTNIATASYSFHPSVTSLSQLGPQAPLILMGASAVEALQPRPPGLNVDFTVHAQPLTWDDKNNNFQFDPPQEVRKAWELVAAITKAKTPSNGRGESMRVLVVGDSDLLTDVVLANPGNGYFALDGIRWVVGDDNIAGEVSTEVDRPIQHTRKQDVFWFYSTVFLAPAVVLIAGLLASRNRRAPKNVGTVSRKETAA